MPPTPAENRWLAVRQQAIEATRPAAQAAQPTPGYPSVLWEHPEVYCVCGRAFTSHRFDTVKAATGDGWCTVFRPHHVVWRLVSSIRIDLPAGDGRAR